MNGGHAEFFVKQSVRDTRKSFRIPTAGHKKTYATRQMPRIRRSLRVEDTEAIHNTIGPILLVMFSVPMLLFMGMFFHASVPFIVLGAAGIIALPLHFLSSRRKRGV